jgi:hypothetical protein
MRHIVRIVLGFLLAFIGAIFGGALLISSILGLSAVPDDYAATQNAARAFLYWLITQDPTITSQALALGLFIIGIIVLLYEWSHYEPNLTQPINDIAVKPQDREMEVEDTTPHEQVSPLGRSPMLLETGEERQIKHNIAVFVAEHVIPTFDSQIELQKTIIYTVCANNKVIRNLAWHAHKNCENMCQYIDHTKLLRCVMGEDIASIPLEKVLESLEAVSKLHHALCSFPSYLAAKSLGYKSHDATRSLYEEWRRRQAALVEAFKPFRRDTRFPRFYNLSGWRRLGEGFETDA